MTQLLEILNALKMYKKVLSHLKPYEWYICIQTKKCKFKIISPALYYNLQKLMSKEMYSKIEKVPRGIRGEKSSKNMTSSRNLVSTIGALASPKMGDGTRCPEG